MIYMYIASDCTMNQAYFKTKPALLLVLLDQRASLEIAETRFLTS